MACNHCDDPVCLKGCPTRAYTKFAEYGAVLQDPDICFGCGYCTWVCPYNAPQLDPVKGQVQKCNMCVDRLEVGLKPACVSACLGNALDFGVIENARRARADPHRDPGFPRPRDHAPQYPLPAEAQPAQHVHPHGTPTHQVHPQRQGWALRARTRRAAGAPANATAEPGQALLAENPLVAFPAGEPGRDRASRSLRGRLAGSKASSRSRQRRRIRSLFSHCSVCSRQCCSLQRCISASRGASIAASIISGTRRSAVRLPVSRASLVPGAHWLVVMLGPLGLD